VTLLSEWEDLLQRRPALRETLEPLSGVLSAWEAWVPDPIAPLAWTKEACHACWARGEPLLAGAPPVIQPDSLEDLLGPGLDVLAGLEENVHVFAEGWDRGEIEPAGLFPQRGRIGSLEVQERGQLSQEALAFLAVAGLRPALAAYFAECRQYITASEWDLGVCPCCGAPPGFADLLEDGRRQLACHLCAASWTFARLVCPLCGNRTSKDFVRLLAEGADEGYAMAACRACRGYVKELDRRLRWNAGSALVEDWGSPHLDFIAHRQDYWRPIPTLVQLIPPAPDEAAES
jgi:Protein involved in formate dehydrogenase formation